jgi:uncharacterized protein YbjT (DUF2867 family)
MRVLVTGATGGVGRAVAGQLVKEGALVRAASRNPAAADMPAGAEIVTGDLNDPTSMEAAFKGVNAVFLYAQGNKLPGLMKAMKEGGVEYVVVLSTIDATNPHPYAQHNRQRHLAVEEAVADAGFSYTHLRPGAFATNALRFWSRSIAAEGIVRIPFPEAQQAPIDPQDIAAVAVRALVSRNFDGQALVLTGPESLTQRQQVQHISAAAGRRIAIETISVQEARDALGRIIPPAYVELLIRQWADEVGVQSPVTDNVQRITGRPATLYADWAIRHAENFRPQARLIESPSASVAKPSTSA